MNLRDHRSFFICYNFYRATYNGTDIYCDVIIPRKLAITVVQETDTVLAFYHTKPYWPVHIVVTPKQHVDSLLSLNANNSDIAKELSCTLNKVAEKVLTDTGAVRVSTNLGDYQDSKHLHFHITSGEPLATD